MSGAFVPRVRAFGLLACLELACGLGGAQARAETAGLSEMVSVVHLHTSLADGASSPLEIAKSARAAGIDALLFTDHFLLRASYAPWPIGNALGVAFSRPSVVSIGVDRYFGELARVESQVPGMTVVAGTEVTPYAHWSGSLLLHTLTLEGWHRHLLVFGLDDAASLRRLPVLGNRAGGAYNVWSLFFIAPAVALAWSARRIFHPGVEEARVGRFRLRRKRRPVREAAVALVSLGLLTSGYPYRVEAFSSVRSDPGDAPFRALIEWVRTAGGVTVWAHPEAGSTTEEVNGIRMTTEPYANLIDTTGADGFAALPEGTRTLLPAGGLWDRALLRSLHRSPGGRLPFAIAESDEHHAAASIDFGCLQTVFLVHQRNRAGILDALASGRFYGRWTPRGRAPLRLLDFHVEGGGHRAISGETMIARAPVTVHLAVDGGDGTPVTALLVRGGEVIWKERATPPIEVSLEETAATPAYYRLDVEGAYPYRLVGNPVVVLPLEEGR